MMKRVVVAVMMLGSAVGAGAQGKWRAATPVELESVLPARAPVDRERIETEMRTATGIVNARGKMVASVLLITAGYAADGKYSHYLLAQTPITLGDSLELPAGVYVIGWKRTDAGLEVQVSEAATVKERGVVLAKPIAQPKRVESFHIWPPEEHRYIQIGRYMLAYAVRE